MQIESQIPLNSDTPLHQEVHQGDGGALVASADPNNVAPQPPGMLWLKLLYPLIILNVPPDSNS